MRKCRGEGCNEDIGDRHKNAKYCRGCAKKRIKANACRSYRKRVKKLKAEGKWKEFKESYNKRQRERYENDAAYREKIKAKSNEQTKSGYRRQLYKKKKNGDVKRIEAICNDFGMSPEVSEAIALDGDALDNMMRKKGLLKPTA